MYLSAKVISHYCIIALCVQARYKLLEVFINSCTYLICVCGVAKNDLAECF